MHPRDIQINDYSYTLPQEKIAQYPLANRDASKLLVFDGAITDAQFAELPNYLPAGAVLVFNNSKVIEARLVFEKSTGSTIEIFCLEPAPHYPSVEAAMVQTQQVQWQCLVGGAKKWKQPMLEMHITTPHGPCTLTAQKLNQGADSYLIDFSWNVPMPFGELLHHAGIIPLPPYLNRATEAADITRYQTVYANKSGSVAAPTAGLHFTDDVFAALQTRNIHCAYVTLHVGAGTFKPVKASTMAGHEMHAEFLEVSTDFVQMMAQNKQPIVAVGTTSLRTIETLYWMGIKASLQPNAALADLLIQQWDAYDLAKHAMPYQQSFAALFTWLQQHQLAKLVCKTQIIIAPGYTLKVADGIVTNFHQPQSTLLLLIAAVVGPAWKTMYEHALQNNYRFLSYGDSSLLWKQPYLPTI